MQILNPGFSLENFFNRLKKSSSSLLMLDYDGTLSPFTADRNNARPYDGVLDKINLLLKSRTTDILIISGRDIKALKRLLDLKIYPELWGCHGAEKFDSKKGYKLSVDQDILAGLRKVKTWLSDNGLDQYAEFKPEVTFLPKHIWMTGFYKLFGKETSVRIGGKLNTAGPKKVRFLPENLFIANRKVPRDLLKFVSAQLPITFNIMENWPLQISGLELRSGELELRLKEISE